MSYLSASENVGFSGIPQNISDASCATQYKMAVEGVSGCGDVNMFIHDNSGDEQTYITPFNDNFFTKFKIDPNELYTFHDTDVVAGEITVSHTEDAYMLDHDKIKLENPSKDLEVPVKYTNGDVKKEKEEIVTNGHYTHISKQTATDIKTTNTKALKTKQVKEPIRRESTTSINQGSGPCQIENATATSNKNSINNVNVNDNTILLSKTSSNETFLDVFKREQGLVDNKVVINRESVASVIKVPTTPPKKASAGKTHQSKQRKGRGPAVHEALQRISIQNRALPVPCGTWHAPGEILFSCGPLDSKRPGFRQVDTSSSDDDNIPDYESGGGPVCVEETAAESRSARLALRRAALRRHVVRAHTGLKLARDYRDDRALATLIKKQLNKQGPSYHLPTHTVNHLLAMRGMPAVLTSNERRRLRESGWSGGESGSWDATKAKCLEEKCEAEPLPCGRYCLAHVTLAAEQRLYAACAAVFAGGARCRHPLLPLHEHTPLCAEHAWKRDNYDKLCRDTRPKKVVRGRVLPMTSRAPRRVKRRRRVPLKNKPPAPPPSAEHSLSEINVYSNSSNYDSSEDTTMGALSENEYIATANNSNELEVEVGTVPSDVLLDPAVLSQIPDEAFTEFFNQAEGSSSFAESSELAAALEAVLDERVLDERALDSITDCVFTPQTETKDKIQVPSSMPSSAPS
ncbi:uncharacterized protein LOC101744487 isoform X1 [Bombyx mori]|uniref:KANL2-like probable zinc-finger domain-containing protein n=1 Tax=Bombyx mori TaxID=7091 RepID=A0A8R2C5L4_BOMMO|nr:uncharacterized protein LOC101744487 isoform X3 [Bombyx mori]